MGPVWKIYDSDEQQGTTANSFPLDGVVIWQENEIPEVECPLYIGEMDIVKQNELLATVTGTEGLCT